MYFKQERQRGKNKTARNPYQVILTKPPDCRVHARLPHSRSSKSEKAHHHAPTTRTSARPRHHAFGKERKEQKAPGGRVTSSPGVKSSGSKHLTSIGQKYISERAGWRAFRALHEQDRRIHAKRSASTARFGVGGGVDIWRSDCVLTGADADRFGRECRGQCGSVR